jgi:hypothetical protein
MKISKATRSIMLRMMLAMLAVDAILGISLVLVDDDDLLRKAALTAFSLSCTLGLLLVGSSATQTPRWAPLGFGLIGFVLMQCLCSLLLIWSEELLPNMFATRVTASWTILFWATFPFCIALRAAGYRSTRAMGFVAAGGTLLGCMLLLILAWARWNTFTSLGLPVTVSFAIATCSWIGGLGLIARDRRPARWQYLCMTLAANTAALWIYTTHLELSRNTNTWGSPILSITVAVGLLTLLAGVITICLAIPLPPAMRWLRHLAIVTAAVAMAAQEFTVIIAADWPDDLSARITVAAWILSTCCLLSMFIMGWKDSWDREDRQNGRTMSIQCPACGRKQQRPLGRSACDRCDQPLWLWCRMVQCPACSYDLTGATTPHCPECGQEIRVPMRPPEFTVSGGE